MTKLLDFVNSYIFGPGLCVAVFFTGIFLLIYLRPFFVTRPRRMLKALKSGGGEGVSPMRAMIVALAGTLGVGNIAGVASAIYIGGSGAIFWMLVSAVAALPIKYAEIVLAVRHRRCDRNGNYHGGAYFYIAERGTRVSNFTASLFAILCLAASLAMGSAVQSSAISVSVNETFSLPPAVCGVIVTTLTFAVVSGGLSRIASLTEKLIPLMSVIYIIMSLFIIITNLPLLGDIISDIVTSAFDKEAMGGGVIGFITSRALRIGVTRGTVSNEAGCGTAPIAHASANVTSPAAQGVFGILEVFIDTIVICSMTALVVLIAGRHGVPITQDGMKTASDSMSHFIPFAEPILCAAIAVFAFCTIVCWFYYGTESLAFLTKSPCARYIYLGLYSLSAFFGAVSSESIVWSFSDLAISAMTALNLVFVMKRIGEVKKETCLFLEKK
ncbi:MAG: amino acid carrier protein [Clostridia bacterium]|nr:amino acid carrier protein [Clostridia bacterium]